MVTTRPPKTIVKPTALGPVANTDTKLLIYGLFKKGRVLAQDGVSYDEHEHHETRDPKDHEAGMGGFRSLGEPEKHRREKSRSHQSTRGRGRAGEPAIRDAQISDARAVCEYDERLECAPHQEGGQPMAHFVGVGREQQKWIGNVAPIGRHVES